METLKKYLTEHKLTQRQFGDMVGTTQTHVSRWVNGYAVPSRRFMKNISDATRRKIQPHDFYPECYE